MHLDVEKPKVNTSEEFKDVNFAIGDLSVIMDILRNRMYVNKIRTICQEISSNARDAHREVGKGHIPIEIKLPNFLDSTFQVRDFGPGITPDRMSNVFVQYGRSTKRDDNTQTGGFGLGTKCPFAYTDSFCIESITPELHYNGHENCLVKRCYVAVVDETRIGKLMLVSEEVSTEAQGTKIIIAVKNGDKDSFARNTADVCYFWDRVPGEPRPIIHGKTDFTWESSDFHVTNDVFKNADWEISIKRYGGDKTIVVDGIPYSLRMDNIDRYKYRDFFDLGYIRMFVGVGKVTLTANREDLEYGKKTIETLNPMIERVKSEFYTKLEEMVAGFNDLWEARKKWLSIIINISTAQTTKWKDFILDGQAIRIPRGMTCHYFQYKNKSLLRAVHSATISPEENAVLILNDLPKIDRDRIKTILGDSINANGSLNKKGAYVLQWNTMTDPIEEAECKQKADEAPFGLSAMKPQMLSSFAPTKNVRSSSYTQTRRSPVKARKLNYCIDKSEQNLSYKNLWLSEEDVDLKDGMGIYVILKDGRSYLYDGSEICLNPDKLIEICKVLKNERFVFDVYGISPTKAKKLGTNWVSLAQVLDKEIEVLSPLVKNYSSEDNKFNLFNIINKSEVELQRNSDGSVKYPNSPFTKYYDNSLLYHKMLKDVSRLSLIMSLKGGYPKFESNPLALEEMMHEVYKKYPLVFHFTNYNPHIQHKDEKPVSELLRDYIDMIDSMG